MTQQSISESYQHMVNLIHESIRNSSLVRLHIVKGRGVKLDIPCKVLNFDEQSHHLSVYNVDNKQVYLVELNEIDDFIICV